MNNLFSIFDPVRFKPWFSGNWVAIVFIFVIPSSFWLTKRKIISGIGVVVRFLRKELRLALGEKSGSIKLFLCSFFLIIFVYNFIGLFPYVFTRTSHLSIRISLSLPLWVGYFLTNFYKNTRRSLAHLVPIGTPLALVPFIVLIEIIRNLIRPLTLRVRLAANMVAGHLLLSLISTPARASNILIMFIIIIILLVIIFLELRVRLIQRYVFITLSSLYISEINNVNNR